MNFNWLAAAVPFFILLMLLEYYVSRRKGRQVFSFEESVANLNVGIAERLCDIFTTGLFFYYFDWLYKNAAIFHFKPVWYHWVLLFIFTDFLWYWYHRLGHEVNLLWSAHVVHHQSEDYNYTVSARITVIQAVFRNGFWSFLPLLGFPAHMITALLLVHGTYPFFTHTQLIGKLGWLEFIFVTPSHHRVHHSSNLKYLDKNYGDVLIIWDKLFGTFAKEEEQPVFGLTKPLNNYSFLWQHFHFTLEMLFAFYKARGFRHKMAILFGRPDQLDPRIRTYLERKLLKRSSEVVKRPLPVALTIQTILTLVLLFLTILFEHYLTGSQLALAAAFIFLSVINTGAMLEQKDWVFYIEYARLLLLYVFVGTWQLYPFVNYALLTLLIGLAVYFRSLNQYYKSVLYKSGKSIPLPLTA